MNSTDFQEELNLKIDAGIPIIQIISYEWRRIMGYCVKTSLREGKKKALFWWSKAMGIRIWNNINKELKKENDMDSAPEVLKWYLEQMPDNSILVMEDIHLFFDALGLQIIDLLRYITRQSSKKNLILAQPIQVVPTELEKDIFVTEIPLPNTDIHLTNIKEIISELNLDDEMVPYNDREAIAKAALGLTEMEAKFTFKEIAIMKKRLTKKEVPLIIQQKEQIIRKSGILEYIHPKDTMNNVGGMERLKDWLSMQRGAFESNAADFGIKAPKGVLLLGVPGCGKSLIAKAIGNSWELPLLKFDMGRTYSHLLGQSESNIRKALNIAEAISPCILWIDEIEKGIAGTSSSDKLDAGVSARVFGTLLTWMQEKEHPVFVVATANNIESLPLEFLRKGRFNEIFFVDLPDPKSRRNIWKIHLKKQMKDRFSPDLFDFDTLVKKSVFYSGSEIEESVNTGLLLAFNDPDVREVNTNDLLTGLDEIYPLSKTMGLGLNKLRKWAEVRVRMASNEKPECLDDFEKDIPKLKQEMVHIPFLE